MTRVLVVSFTQQERDPRVNRQLRALSDEFSVTAAGTGTVVPHDGVEFVPLSWREMGRPRSLAAFIARKVSRIAPAAGFYLRARSSYEDHYWRHGVVRDALARLQEGQWDVVISNDLETLPLCSRLASDSGAALVFDAHEFAPLEWTERLGFRLFERPYREYLLRSYGGRAQAVTTVSAGIAEALAPLVGRPVDHVVVITNAATYQPDLVPSQVREDAIRLVHHGMAAPVRNITGLLDTMELLRDDPRFVLTLMFAGGEPGYLAEIERRAQALPNVEILPPVPMSDLPRATNQYDMGVYLLPPSSFNNAHALPNKFFEFVQARIGVATGPSPEMARLVKAHGLGVIAADFSPTSLARELRQLDASDIRRFKAAAQAAARELSAENGKQQLVEIVRRVASRREQREREGPIIL